MTAAELIPEMTHPLGQHWDQPKREDILIDREGRALVSTRVFKALPEYSSTIPTGVYEGKMWRRHEGDRWFLCWYGPSDKPDQCSINARILLPPEA
jgi:hypothetical protein